MEDVTYMIIRIVVSVVAALIAAYLIPYIKTVTADAKYAKLVEMVKTCVWAAEQTVQGSGQGKIKKEQVVTFLTAWLNEHNIKIDAATLDNLIESAVYTLKQTQEGWA